MCVWVVVECDVVGLVLFVCDDVLYGEIVVFYC